MCISNKAIATIGSWLKSVGLKLASHETKAVLITDRKRREIITLTVGEYIITSKPSIKYLGLMIDAQLFFKDQSMSAAGLLHTMRHCHVQCPT